MGTTAPNLEDQPKQPVQAYISEQNSSKLPPHLRIKNSLANFAFLKFGSFEIFFVLVILVISFLILNFFSVLRLSSLYPDQLGWLPHQPYANSPDKSTLNAIAINPITIQKGAFLESPMTLPNGEIGIYPTSIYPTIVAKESNAKDDTQMWIAVSLYGDRLTRQNTLVPPLIINGIKSPVYIYKGITIWYLITSNTAIRVMDPHAKGGSILLGKGLKYISKYLVVGQTVQSISSSLYPNFGYSSLSQSQITSNIHALSIIENGVGKINNQKDKSIEFVADLIVIQ